MEYYKHRVDLGKTHDVFILSYKTINEHLYIYSALPWGWTFNEYRHIANALTLAEIMEFTSDYIFKRKL